MKRLFVFIMISFCAISSFAQNDIYDERVPLSNNLYKVKSGPFYGVVDNEGKVIVSVEYDDIKFNEGKALLLKNNYLYDWVDTLGKTSGYYFYSRKINDKYPYFMNNYVLVTDDEKWGYVDAAFQTINYLEKEKKNKIYHYDLAFPFIEGIAVVYSEKYGWQHIDNKHGSLKFNISSQEEVLFRSSVYNGECIIVTPSGIKQYQNNENGCVVKRVLTTSATPQITQPVTTKKGAKLLRKKESVARNMMEYMKGMPVKIVFAEGTLELDSLMRVKRFVSPKNTVVFVEPSKPKPEKKQEKRLTPEKPFEEKIEVQVAKNTIYPNAEGYATAKVILKNRTEKTLENLSVELECSGRTKSWEGTLPPSSTVSISITFPARFSESEIRREISTLIKSGKNSMTNAQFIKVKRYVPSNRR